MKARVILVNSIILAVSLCISLVLAELAWRSFEYVVYRYYLYRFEHPLFLRRPDKPYYYSLKKNFENKVCINGDTYCWSYKTDALGLRVVDSNDAAKENAGVLLALGDSYTFGVAVNQSESWPDQLSGFLAKKGLDVKVVNGGIPGFNTSQEAAYLPELLDSIPEVRMVVLAYIVNDAEPQLCVPTHPKDAYASVDVWVTEPLKMLFNLASSVLGFEKRFVEKKRMHHFEYVEGYHNDSFKWRESMAGLESIKRQCAEHNVLLRVVMIPDFTQEFGDSYSLGVIHEKVVDWGCDLNIKTIDLLPKFRNQDSSRLRVEGEGHPNAEGQREIALYISEFLEPDKDIFRAKKNLNP